LLHRLRAVGIAGAALLVAASCNELTPHDQRRLADLKARFGDTYTFSTTDVYLLAQARRPGRRPADEWMEVYTAFWLYDGRPRPDTALVYLNTYGSDGTWLGQYYWDPQRKQVEFSRRRQFY
jgi:hypothetical protein